MFVDLVSEHISSWQSGTGMIRHDGSLAMAHFTDPVAPRIQALLAAGRVSDVLFT